MNPRPNMKCLLPLPADVMASPFLPVLLNALNAEFLYVNSHIKNRYTVVDLRKVDPVPGTRAYLHDDGSVSPDIPDVQGGVEVWFRKDPIPAFAVRRKGWGRLKPMTKAERDTPVYEETGFPATILSPILTAGEDEAAYFVPNPPPVDPAALESAIQAAIAAATGQKIAKAVPGAVTLAVMEFFGVEAAQEPPAASLPPSLVKGLVAGLKQERTELDAQNTPGEPPETSDAPGGENTPDEPPPPLPTAPATLETPEPFESPAEAPEPAPEPDEDDD